MSFVLIFLDAEGGSQKASVVVVVISSLKIRKAFLICSGAQRNFALHIRADIPQSPQIYRLRFLNLFVINE